MNGRVEEDFGEPSHFAQSLRISDRCMWDAADAEFSISLESMFWTCNTDARSRAAMSKGAERSGHREPT